MTETIVNTQEELENHLMNGKTVVLFTAPSWCIPCQRFEPHWLKAADLVSIPFVKVDMGTDPEDTFEHWATAEYGIRGVPTVILFDGDSQTDIKSRAVVPLIKELDE